MISILIVEDSKYKRDALEKLLIEGLMINPSNISIVEDIKSAKKLLVKKTFDLLILDLVLPLESGDDPSPEKGVGFLRDLESNPSLFPPIHIIGLTEFGDLQETFKKEFEKYLWHLVSYSASDINWQERLKTLTYHLISTKKRFAESSRFDHKFDIAVITALNKPEFEKILEWPVEWEKFTVDGDPTVYYKTTIQNKNGNALSVLASCVDQMGMTATAVLTTKLVHTFHPKYIIMGGICAGLKEKDLNYGDILIAEQCWDYGSGKMKEAERTDAASINEIIFEADPRPIQLSSVLKAKANSFVRRNDVLAKIQYECKYNKPTTVLKAEIGPVASGSYVISSLSKLKEIKSYQRKLLGVEMEGYGLYYSCDHNEDLAVKGIMIKSVSDFGDATKNDQFQDYSSYTSSQFIFHFIIEEF